MRKVKLCFTLLLLGMSALCRTAWGWDTFYDGSLLPNAEGWRGDWTGCRCDGGILRILDNRVDWSGGFFTKTVSSYGPITAETRVRVASASDLFAVNFIATNYDFTTWLSLFPQEVRVRFGWGESAWQSFPVDMSTFRVIRIATDSHGNSHVWIDGTLLVDGVTSVGSQSGSMAFGGDFGSMAATSDSYWDYVAASADYLPVPEPSSLLALGGGLLGLGLLRRRSKQ